MLLSSVFIVPSLWNRELEREKKNNYRERKEGGKDFDSI